MNPTVDALIAECTQAARDGAEFPEIWDSILRSHRMVASPPIETFDEAQPHLEVRLRNGYWLRYCANSNDFSLRRAKQHRSF
jgi:hypothetical protein